MTYTPPQGPQQPQQPGQQPPQYAQPGYGAPMGPLPPAGPGEPFDGATSPDDLTRPLYGASFGQAIRRFFKSYARFSGRASRSEYWWVQLFIFLVQLIPIPFFVIGVVMLSTAQTGDAAAGRGMALVVFAAVIIGVLALALLIPQIAISWRRLHDANFAGPFWFLSLTSVGSIVVLVFMLLGPKPEGRRFDLVR